ncbi:MAG: STAS domain-containing protein [Polyangiaceae bacterium]|nr:STAS domain-containing protein [Polyangiaceae bacterium]
MRCDRCALDPEGGEGLSLTDFLEKVAACSDCPLLQPEGAPAIVRALGQRYRDAARHVRRLESRTRQQQNEIAEMHAEMQKYEARIANLEALHLASTRELRDQIELVTSQEAAMRAMSTPLIRVWEGVLALPVIGRLDRARAELILTILLAEIQEKGTSHAIIDLTGVGEIDEATADHLLRISSAAELLGARVILTGMQGRVAQALVALQADLSGVAAVGNVEDAIRMAMAARRRG